MVWGDLWVEIAMMVLVLGTTFGRHHEIALVIVEANAERHLHALRGVMALALVWAVLNMAVLII
jgi:hypothetical protein